MQYIYRGDIWWCDLPAPFGDRPVLVLQSGRLNKSAIETIMLLSFLLTCQKYLPIGILFFNFLALLLLSYAATVVRHRRASL